MKINHHRIIEGVWTPWYFSHGEVTSDNSISRTERDKVFTLPIKKNFLQRVRRASGMHGSTFIAKIRESTAKKHRDELY